MIFEKIRFKNILSYGNSFTELDLNSNQNTIISGANGQGKSTILDSISFVLTGKAYRKIKKEQLINSINKKGLEVELYFSNNGNSYIIKRGIKPDFLYIFENGIKIDDEASVKSQQEILEGIIGFSSKVPKQTFAVSSRFYSPFLEMNSATKREFIENIFSIGIFSDMNDLLKKKKSSLKLEVKDKEKDVEKYESNIDLIKELTSNDTEKDVGLLDQQLRNLTIETKTTFDYVEKLKIHLKDREKKYKSLNDENELKLSQIKRQYILKKSTLDELNKQIKYYSTTDFCSVCKQEISEETKLKESEKLLSEAVKLDDYIDELNTAETKLLEKRDKLDVYNDKNLKISNSINIKEILLSKNEVKIKSLSDEIKTLKKNSSDNEEKIKKFNDLIEEIKSELLDLNNKSSNYNVIGELLSEKGMKQYIINKYIPLINKLVNEFLQILEAPYSILFDDKLNETIHAIGYDNLSYGNLSSGEKQRIDLAVLFAFIEISKLQNTLNSNFIIIDEVLDASLDESGIENVIKILNIFKSKGYSIFVISHRCSINTEFDRNLIIEKKVFSEIKEVE